ncbi:hypothetical protein K438DRAFT_1763730 [Mycena galopus ATCC 62051]|nr:hypothetical protein K438DRAFT_1763730 [Mycena galopus ATCC 62051]
MVGISVTSLVNTTLYFLIFFTVSLREIKVYSKRNLGTLTLLTGQWGSRKRMGSNAHDLLRAGSDARSGAGLFFGLLRQSQIVRGDVPRHVRSGSGDFVRVKRVGQDVQVPLLIVGHSFCSRV